VENVSGAALVVGGASGIGSACVAALEADGWDVVVADLRPDRSPPHGVEVDVRDRDAVHAVIEQMVETHDSLGAVVYAAGVARVTGLLDITASEWDLVTGVNLTGVFNVLTACVPHIVPGGSFTLISSVDSQAPVAGLAHYSAAKAGGEALMRSAALELGHLGIRCNAVLPGVVRTPLMAPMLARPGLSEKFAEQTPLGRLGHRSLDSGRRRDEPPRAPRAPRRPRAEADRTKGPRMSTDQQAPSNTQRCEALLREIVSIRSVVGEETTAHLWLSDRLREAGMTVEHYAVEGRRTPLVLGTFEGSGNRPAVRDAIEAFLRELEAADPESRFELGAPDGRRPDLAASRRGRPSARGCAGARSGGGGGDRRGGGGAPVQRRLGGCRGADATGRARLRRSGGDHVRSG